MPREPFDSGDMTTTQSFASLLREVRACTICAGHLPHEPRPVLRAKPPARLVIAGQAPGTRVHASGMPFTDPSGDRLRDWMGVDKEMFYDDTKIAIVPMGFCFPGLDAKGGDLPPRKECAPAWRQKVFAGLKNVELMLLVGGYAQAWHLGDRAKASLTETVKAWRAYGPAYIPLPHPSWRNNAWIKKNPWFEEELLPHLRRRVSRILKS
jgi:uracil-DNA glycosylase